MAPSEPISPRLRRIAIALLLFTQTLFFFAFQHRPPVVESDNIRYELAAWNVANGRGLSLPFTDAPDRDVREWVCTRHPDACVDGSYPVAIYPPGYSYFVAGIYELCGRRLWPLVLAQLALLWLLFALFEQLAARKLGRSGYVFAMGVATVYPFIAAQASRVMADHLGVVLFVAALAAHLLLPPGRLRGVLFGGLGALATLTRPYALLVFPVLFAWPSVWRAARAPRIERLLAVVAFVLPIACWSARNYYEYGRFIPLTTNGVGLTLMHTTLEFDADLYEAPEERYYGDIVAKYGDDGLGHASSRALQRDAIARIRARPLKFVQRVLVHIPKLWISLGNSGHGVSRAWPALLLFLGSLWLLGLAGMVYTWRRDETWHVLTLAILMYWCFLLPLPGEARRTLPLRLPHLLLAATFVGMLYDRWRARRAA